MLTQERLKKLLYYDPETGVWTRLISLSPNTKVGEKLYCSEKSDYLHIQIDGKIYKSSRLAFFYMTGSFPINDIDHKNRNTKDDKWCNLREATTSQNCMNRGLRKDNSSGVTGVSWVEKSQKWRVRVTLNGKSFHLGCYEKFSEAVKVRKMAELEYFDNFAP